MSRIYPTSHSTFRTSQQGTLSHTHVILAVMSLDIGTSLFAIHVTQLFSCQLSSSSCTSNGDLYPFITLYGVILLSCLAAFRMYEFDHIANTRKNSNCIILASGAALLLPSGILFILDIDPSFARGSLIFFSLTVTTLIIVQRIAVARIIKSALAHGKLASRAVVLVMDDASETLAQNFDYSQVGYRVIQSFLLPSASGQPSSHASWADLTRQVTDYLQQSHVEEVHINVVRPQYEGLKVLMTALGRRPITIRVVPDAMITNLMRRPTVNWGESVAIEAQRVPLTAAASIQKRLLDISISILALAVCLPIVAMIGLAIRLDSRGPIIFRQTRRGFKDSVFRIYKFRTMTVLEDGPVVNQAKHNDPRVTRVGRWLRRTSLDELPQLFNVIKGEMSLVGPRPHAIAHDNEFSRLVNDYELRSHVKPGITGWAQIHGMRGETSTTDLIRKRVELDIYYVKNCTLFLDIEILAKTLVHLFRHYRSE